MPIRNSATTPNSPKRSGLRQLKPFFFEKGQHIGLQSSSNVRRDELEKRLANVLRIEPKVIPGGPETCHMIGIVTGGAGDEVKKAHEEGVGHLYHRRRPALDLRPRGGTRHQRLLRRPLRDRNVRRESSCLTPRRQIQSSLGICGVSDGL